MGTAGKPNGHFSFKQNVAPGKQCFYVEDSNSKLITKLNSWGELTQIWPHSFSAKSRQPFKAQWLYLCKSHVYPFTSVSSGQFPAVM